MGIRVIFRKRIVVYATLRQANQAKPNKQGNEAPGGAKVWPRHAGGRCHPLALRARRAPQNVPLRGSPASGALRLPALHRDPPPRLSTAEALRPHPLRRTAVGVRRLVKERDDRLKRRSMAQVKGEPNCASDFSKPLARACFFRRAALKWRRSPMSCCAERRSLGDDSVGGAWSANSHSAAGFSLAWSYARLTMTFLPALLPLPQGH